jgi:hypothetical protein
MWEETVKELKRGSDLESLKKRGETVRILDGVAVESIIDLLIRTVGTFGYRIEQLEDHHWITLLVGFKGDKEPPFSDLGNAADGVRALSFLMGRRDSSRASEDVIIQIPMTGIIAFKKTLDLASLKKTCRIMRFPGGKTKEKKRKELPYNEEVKPDSDTKEKMW